jgi:beta-lactamase regulating signal transducer with metallopeptidase domain
MLAKITETLAPAFPWLIAVGVKSLAVLLITALLARCLRRASAALRHFVYSAGVCAALLLPVAALLLPVLRVPVLPAPASADSTSREAPQAGFAVAAPTANSQGSVAARESASAPRRSPRVSTSTQQTPVAASVGSEATSRATDAPITWRGAVVLVWLLGCFLLLLRAAIAHVRLRRLVRTARAVESIPMSSRLRWLSRDLGIRREVALLEHDKLEVPIATGVFSPRIVLSPQSVHWTDARREAVLCHELAHIRRLDALTQFFATVACAVYWVNPLVWFAAVAMRAERERACDDYVLAYGAPASDYAHDLLEIVSGLRRRSPAAALAMARRSQLEGRLMALLSPRVRHERLSRRAAFAICAGILAVALPAASARFDHQQVEPAVAKMSAQSASAAPAPYRKVAGSTVVADTDPQESPAAPASPAIAPAPPAGPASPPASAASFSYHNSNGNGDPLMFGCFRGERSSSTNISSHTDHDGRNTWSASWVSDACSIEAHSSGKVQLNAEATAIDAISPGGYFEISQREGDNLRRLRLDAAAGQLQYTYKVNGTVQPFDAAARQWFSTFLLELERSTGYAADTRVPALLAKGGPQAVLNEIDHLRGDYVRHRYFSKLFENAKLSPQMLAFALNKAAADIHTDYDLAQVLISIAQNYSLDDETERAAYLSGANKLTTDYEHARVLIELLKRPNLSSATLRSTLESAKSIHTDYEKSRILAALADKSNFSEADIATYLDLASSIGTDYEHSRSIMALLQNQKLSPAAVSQLLKSASTIGTDYEKSRVLLAVNGSANFDERQIASYLSLVDSLGTDYERSRDLIGLMQQHKLATESVEHILKATQKIGTDYEKARVLSELAQRYSLQGPLHDAYLKAAESIASEYDRNRILAAMVRKMD